MDELLKASARKRRAEFGTDPAMPNPLRARLHEEIAALARTKERPSRGFSFIWPRFALAAAAVALIIGLPLVWQWRESMPPKVISARDANPAAESPEANQQANEKASAAATETMETKSAAQAAAAPALAAKSGSISQQFSQSLAKERLKDAKTPNILNNFRLEQNGESVRVIDADGSTYTGKIERLARTDARALSNQKLDFAARAQAAAAAKKEKEQPANEYYIRARGYNTQLQKPLSFEGNYIAPLSSNETQTNDDAGNKESARIVGTARIEGAPPVEVDATAVPP